MNSSNEGIKTGISTFPAGCRYSIVVLICLAAGVEYLEIFPEIQDKK